MKKVLLISLLPLTAYAEEAVKQGWVDKIMAALASAEGASATIAVVVEFILRVVPSKKPMSIAHAVSAAVRTVARVAEKLADVLDKVLPQKTK